MAQRLLGMKKYCEWLGGCYGWMRGMDEEVLQVAQRSLWRNMWHGDHESEVVLWVARWSVGMKCTEMAMEEASQVARRLLCQTWPQGGTTDSDTVSVLEVTHVVTSHLATPYPSPPGPLLQVCLRVKV